VKRGFTVTDEMVNDFKEFLVKQRVRVDEAAFANDVGFIKAMIHLQVNSALFGIEEARRNLIAQDPMAQQALSLFPEAEKLMSAPRSKTTQARPKQ
jgi:hypothetical protein